MTSPPTPAAWELAQAQSPPSPLLLLAHDFDLLPPPNLTAWHFAHLSYPFITPSHLLPYGLSLLPAHQHPSHPSLTPSNPLSTIYSSTRLLMMVDLSPSISIVDPTTSLPLYSTVLTTLTLLLTHLSTSPLLPHSTLHLSIIASNPSSSTPLYPLLLSATLSPPHLDALIETITARIMQVENHQAEEQQRGTGVAMGGDRCRGAWEGDKAPEVEEEEEGLGAAVWDEVAAGGGGFHLLLHQALFFLDRMPSSAAPSLLLLTDNVLPLSTSLSSHSSILSLLIRRSIPLSLLQLTSSSPSSSFSFGYVPDTEIVRYATRVTGGVFAGQEAAKEMLDRGPEEGWSALERAVFVRGGVVQSWSEVDSPRESALIGSLTRHKLRQPSLSTSAARSSPFASVLTVASYLAASTSPSSFTPSYSSSRSFFPSSIPHPSHPSDSYQPLLRERLRRYTMDVDVLRVLECRHREGFHAFVHHRSPRLSVLMRKEWRPGVYIDWHLDVEEWWQEGVGQGSEAHGAWGKMSVTTLKRSTSLGVMPVSEVKASVSVIASRSLLDAVHSQRVEAQQSEKKESMDFRDSAAWTGGGVVEQARALWQYVEGMALTDVLLVHLAKVSLDSTELYFTHAKSELMLIRDAHTFPFQPSAGHSPPTLPLSSPPAPTSALRSPPSITLPSRPYFVASSHLSSSHPLWDRLAKLPLSTLRRYFSLSSFSILSSLHRTSQLSVGVELELEQELDEDFASLARVQHQRETEKAAHSYDSRSRNFFSPRMAGAEKQRGVGEAAFGAQPQTWSGIGHHDVSETLCRLLQGWSSVAVSDVCFVFFPPPPPSSSDDSTAVHGGLLCASYTGFAFSSLPFALLRLKWRTKFLCTLTIAYHACDPHTQAVVRHSLHAVISSAEMRVKEETLLGEGQDRDGVEQREEREEKVDEEEKEDTPHMARSFSARSTDAKPLPPPVYPFGVVQQPLEALIIRPSFMLASTVSELLFRALFPSSTDSLVPPLSYEMCQLQLSLLRSYMRYQSWTWELTAAVSVKSATRLLRGARAEEGFVLVASTGRSSTWVREVQLVQPAEQQPSPTEDEERKLETYTALHHSLTSPISPVRHPLIRSMSTPTLPEQRLAHLQGQPHLQSVPPSLVSASVALSHIPPSSDPPRPYGRPSSCLLQYCVTEVDATLIHTEVCMEPFYGLYHYIPPPVNRSPAPAALSYHTLTSEQLFLHLTSWVHSTDLHLLSALCTFDSVGELQLDLQMAHARSSHSQPSADTAQRPSTDSTGLQLHLVDDFHAQPGFDYEADGHERFMSRLSSAACHPTLQLSIGTVNRLLGLLKMGSQSAMYATLSAHGGSLADLSGLDWDKRSASAAHLANVAISFDDLAAMRMKKGAAAIVAPEAIREQEQEEEKRITGSPPPRFSTPHRPLFSLTSPLSMPLRSSLKSISPLASPSLSAQTPSTDATRGQEWELGLDGKAADGDEMQRLRHRQELVPFSLTFLLECSTPTPLILPLPSSASQTATGPSSPSHDDAASFASQTQPLSTVNVTPFSPSLPLPASRRSSGSTHSHSFSTSALPDISLAGSPALKLGDGSTPYSRSTLVSPTHRVHRGDSTQGDAGVQEDGASTLSTPLSLSAMLVMAAHRLSDVELIQGRCYAVLVNEYTLVIVVLPSSVLPKPPLSDDTFHPRPWRGTDAGAVKEREEERKKRELHAYLDALLAMHGGGGDDAVGELRAVVYECVRDELKHPRAFWAEGDRDLPQSASMASFASFASFASSSHLSTASGQTPSPCPSPPHTPAPGSPQPAPHTTPPAPPVPDNDASIPPLTDGRYIRQVASQKSALLLWRVRLQALRFLLSSTPLLLARPPLSDAIHQALSLATGTAIVEFAPITPVGSPKVEFTSPVQRPINSPEPQRTDRGREHSLTSPAVWPNEGFQLEETVDEDEVARQLSFSPAHRTHHVDEESGVQEEKEREREEEATEAVLLASGSSRLSSDAFSTPRLDPSGGVPSVDAGRVSPVAGSVPSSPCPAPPSAAELFAERLRTAHLRNYAKWVYAALRRVDDVAVEEIRTAVAQCHSYDEELDLTAIQRREEGDIDSSSFTPSSTSSLSPSPAAVERLHKRLQRLLTSDFKSVEDLDMFVFVGEQQEASRQETKPAPATSILSAIQSRRAPQPKAPSAALGRADDDDDVPGVPLPLFLQLRGFIRGGSPPPSQRPSSPGTPAPPHSPSTQPPLQSHVHAETDLSLLSAHLQRFQQPPHEEQEQGTSEDLSPVRCFLTIRALTLPQDSSRLTNKASAQHGPKGRDVDAESQQSAGLYGSLPRRLRPIVLRLFDQLKQAVGECSVNPSVPE